MIRTFLDTFQLQAPLVRVFILFVASLTLAAACGFVLLLADIGIRGVFAMVRQMLVPIELRIVLWRARRARRRSKGVAR